MKVLREFNKSEIPTMTVECRKSFYGDKHCCGSLLEVEPKDIKYSHIHLGEENDMMYHYIVCPVCGARVEVEYRVIPTEIRKLI
jgi:DNA-directed RNA polymerase subunit RPC12/RpoP